MPEINRKRLLTAAGVAVMAAGLFVAGFFIGDDSGQVADLEDRVASLESDVDSSQDSLISSEGSVSDLEAEVTELEEELEAQRELHGESTKADERQEYDTDFAWNTAGTVGYLTIRPTDLSKQGARWILSLEAKNGAQEPKSPFCGDAGAAITDTEGNLYSGEAVIAETTSNCEELQPGLTGTYKAEFQLPAGADPAVVQIFGDYELEEEAKSWELP